MSTCSVIGEIRNSHVRAVFVKFDGYPSGVGADIQHWLSKRVHGAEAFMVHMLQYSRWATLDEPFTYTKGFAPEFDSLDAIARNVWAEWVYIFNFDTGVFYVCDTLDDHNMVVCQCPIAYIHTLDFDVMSPYEDDDPLNDEWQRRELPVLTLSGTEEVSIAVRP